MTDPVLQILFPKALNPEWAFAFRSACDRMEDRAKLLGYLHPTKKFMAVYMSKDDGVSFEVYADESNVGLFAKLEEQVCFLRYADYGIK